MTKSPLINILCKDIPGNVTRPLYQEYDKRLAEINRIWAKEGNNYQVLMEYEETVQSLLAASLFYRHVLGHLKGAAGFYNDLNKQQEKECVIKIGSSSIDQKQYNKLLGATIAFGEIKITYQIQDSFFEFSETVQFLRNCMDLYNRPEYEEDNSI
ncbi:MAG: hypothetical protein IKZ52_06565 [Bacteroidales bacterium]|nr:hypothetical protein [Bacteroidales bacterium]